MGGATFFVLPGDLPFFVQYRNKWMLPSSCRLAHLFRAILQQMDAHLLRAGWPTFYRATFQLMDGFALVFLIFLQLSK